ncbi:D-tyrosyl-tRNA(Tyr) deacylase [bacterium]|nr:D-tyrosyl-tRNA(Tyr) deacylase [bacterium]
MKLVLQRVQEASVTVDKTVVGAIGRGWLILVGFAPDDTEAMITKSVAKVLDLRAFSDTDGKMNLSLRDIAGEVLVVSQFTLYGDCSKGRRPSFGVAASPDLAKSLYNSMISVFESEIPGLVQTGAFGANMQVSLVNDGPVTFVLE